ncbi:peroxidase [Xylariaceae sp. FL0255]|nr:peroxidase [Xylariaceae sp. FL0255]
MRLIALVLGLAATQAQAYPVMDKLVSDIATREDFQHNSRSMDIFADLLTAPLSVVGSTIKSILEGTSALAEDSSTSYTPPGALGSAACSSDRLCVWYYAAGTMSASFTSSQGCTDLARGAIRLGFHDAAAWYDGAAYGGADGSILLTDELTRAENKGLATIAMQMQGWYTTYHPYGAGMADLIQLGAILGISACPGGPRIRAFTGRIDNPTEALPNLLPSPFASAQSLIDLFAAKTFTASDLVALVGAHTASRQFFVDPTRAGAPQDSDPTIWDTSFYRQTLAGDNTSILIFPSDKALSAYSSTRGSWAVFSGSAGQSAWAPAFSQAYFRMSMLGVLNMNNLTEITQVLP